MSKTVLFSPVGGTDPISQNNIRDGSLLHICRWYKPDEVYLYMSKEMLDFQEQDDRYRFCIQKLAEQQSREIVIKEIERSDLINVQDYDYYYSDFRSIIADISASLSSEDNLILNVSSGTPAMKSGLIVLATLGEFNCKTIQVVTPVRKINEHNHKNYDVQTLWELNEDNNGDSENRCKEVVCPTLSNIKQEEIIKRLLKVYDYQAAYLAAESLPSEITINYLELLHVAYKRIQLDNQGLNALVKKHNMEGFPIKNDGSREIFEYALALDIKRKRGEYADFARAISPLIVALFRDVLLKQEQVRIEDYTKNENGREYWDRGKLAGTKLDEIFKNKWPYFKYDWPQSSHISLLTQKLITNPKIVDLCSKLRSVEEGARNVAAHQIVSLTEDGFKKKTGYSPADVSGLIKELCKYTTLNIKDEYWNAYDDMNNYIIKKIEEV